MARVGMLPGMDANTKLYMRFHGGSLLDESGEANHATATGSPTYQHANNYYGHGITFASASDYLTLAETSFAISDDLTIDTCVHKTDAYSTAGYIISRRGGSGNNDQFELLCNTSGQVSFSIWDSSQTLATVTTSFVDPVGFGTNLDRVYATNRTVHIRAVYEAGVGLSLFVNGVLAAYEATALADIEPDDLSPPTIGRTNDTGGGAAGGSFVGTISYVVVRAVADTDVTGLACNLGIRDRLDRRKIHTVEIDLKEHLEDESWTDSGNFYLDAFDLEAYIADGDDLGDMRGKAAADTSVTTLTRVYDTSDLDTDNWFYDVSAGRLWVSEDPTSDFDALLTLEVTHRSATRGMVKGGRYYRPLVTGADGAELRVPYLFEPYPAGGGSQIQLAAQDADAPDGFTDEEATGIVWTGATVRMYEGPLCLSLSSSVQSFAGFVDAQPVRNQDVIDVRTLAEYGRFHRLQLEAEKASTIDYADLYPPHDGRPWPTILGGIHRNVEAVCIDDTFTAGKGYRFKVTNHAITRVSDCHEDGGDRTFMYDIDLSDATFYATIPKDAVGRCLVSVWGYGTPSNATDAGPLTEFGAAADCDNTPLALLKHVLSTYADIAAASMTDASWADTASRAARPLRSPPSVFDSPGAITDAITAICAASLTRLYQLRAGTWAWKDVDKGTAIDWYLYDSDVIAESWPSGRSMITKRVTATASEWVRALDGHYSLGRATSLATKGGDKYRAQKTLSLGRRWLQTKATVDSWLADIRGHFEQPTVFLDVTVTSRLADVELMDVVSVQLTSRPASATARMRVMKIQPRPNSNLVDLRLFSEDHWPADGTAVEDNRDAMPWVQHASYGDPDGTACTDASWTKLGDHLEVYQGTDAYPYPAGTTHRGCIYAERTGGSADTDFQVRLYDLDNAVTIWSIDGIGGAGFYNTDDDGTFTVGNIPSGNARIQFQQVIDNGATGELWAAGWESVESAPELSEGRSPDNFLTVGSAAGWTCSAPQSTPAYVPVSKVLGYQTSPWSPGVWCKWAVYVEAAGCTDFTLQLVAPIRAGVVNYGVVDFGTIAADGIVTSERRAYFPVVWAELYFRYTIGGVADAKVFALNLVNTEEGG